MRGWLCLQLHCRGEGKRASDGSNSADKLNYGVMLLEFLELYGLHFNYRWTGISVRNRGHYIEKKDDISQGLYVEDPTNPGIVLNVVTFVWSFVFCFTKCFAYPKASVFYIYQLLSSIIILFFNFLFNCRQFHFDCKML